MMRSIASRRCSVPAWNGISAPSRGLGRAGGTSRGDEEALEQALSVEAPDVAFVVSKPKREKIFEYLREKGIASERLNRVHAPAGLQIGAVSPEEIAVSILAEIVQFGRSKPQLVPAPSLPTVTAEAKDPICGMLVNPGRAKYQSDYQDRTFYFCCAHCKQTFDKDPGNALALQRN